MIDSTFDLNSLGLAARPAETERGGDLGQEDFLKLMVTQFRNQDPFKPMENGEFLGQLAQFGTVSGIEELEGSFSQLSEALVSNQALQASALVGRTVLADTDTGVLQAGRPLQGAAVVPFETDQLEVQITDASGRLVQTLQLGPQSAGLVRFEWPGVDSEGRPAAPGAYTLAAQVRSNGTIEAAPTLVAGRVDSVSLHELDRGLILNLDGIGEVAFTQVREISAG